MATKGVRFGHVALRTSDVDRIVRWYDNAFGAKKVFHAPRDGERQEADVFGIRQGAVYRDFYQWEAKSRTTR